MEHEVAISQLRDVLGITYLHVARGNDPVIVARCGRPDVADHCGLTSLRRADLHSLRINGERGRLRRRRMRAVSG